MVRSTLRSISNVKFAARKSLFALAGLALWLAATHTVSAQGFGAGVGFQRTKFRPFSGEIKVVDNTRPGLKNLATINVKPAMDQAAARLRQDFLAKVPKMLREYNLGGGWRTYNTVLKLGVLGPMQVAADGRGFTLKATIPGNAISVSLRTPTPIGSYGDPRFTLHFDLVLTLDVEPTLTSIAVKGGVKVSVQNARILPANVVAGIGFAVAGLIDTLSGFNVIGLVEREINTRAHVGLPFNQEFSKLSAAVRSIPGPNLNMRFLPGVLSARYLMIAVDRVAPLPVIR